MLSAIQFALKPLLKSVALGLNPTRRPALWAGILVVALAGWLRVSFMGYGLPFLFYEDEPIYLKRALDFGFGDFDPDYFKKPSFFLYLYYGAYALFYGISPLWSGSQVATSWGAFVAQTLADPTAVMLCGRGLTIAFAVATVGLLVLIGKRLNRTWVGIIAALMMAINPTHGFYSARIISDIPCVFAVVLTLYASLGILKSGVSQQGRWRDYILAFFAVALAMGFKYNGFCLVIPVVAHFARIWLHGGIQALWQKNAWASMKLWAGLSLAAVAFLVMNPFVMLNLDRFLLDLNLERKHLLVRDVEDAHRQFQWFSGLFKIGFKILPNGLTWPWFGMSLFSLTVLVTCAVYTFKQSLAGHAAEEEKHHLLKMDMATLVVLLSFPAVFLLITSQFQLVNSKYLLPVYPFFYLMVAWVFIHLGLPWFQRKALRKTVHAKALGVGLMAALVIGLAVVPWLQFSRQIALYQKPDTRAMAYGIILEKLSAKGLLYAEPETLPLGMPPEIQNAGIVVRHGPQKGLKSEQDLKNSSPGLLPASYWQQYDRLPLNHEELEKTVHPEWILLRLKPRSKEGEKYFPYGLPYYRYLAAHYHIHQVIQPYGARAKSSARGFNRLVPSHERLLGLYHRLNHYRKDQLQPGDPLVLLRRNPELPLKK